ncbi:MAG: hypothetical protein WKF54_10075 [Nocardioidaceae bacterium]
MTLHVRGAWRHTGRNRGEDAAERHPSVVPVGLPDQGEQGDRPPRERERVVGGERTPA